MMGSMAEPVGRFVIYDNPLTGKELFQAGLSGWGSTGAGFSLGQIWTGVSGPASGPMSIARSGIIFVPSTAIALYGTLRYGTQIQPQTGTPLFPAYAQAPEISVAFSEAFPGVPAPVAPPPPRLLEPGEVLDSPTTEPLRVVVRPGETCGTSPSGSTATAGSRSASGGPTSAGWTASPPRPDPPGHGAPVPPLPARHPGSRRDRGPPRDLSAIAREAGLIQGDREVR